MSKKPPVDELGSFRSRGHGSKFSRKMEAAVAALLSERNVEEAARVAGIGTQTLRRWMKDPEFQAAYLEARRAAVAQSNARLQQYSSAAVSTLFKVMLDPSAPASTPSARSRFGIGPRQAEHRSGGHRGPSRCSGAGRTNGRGHLETTEGSK